MKNEKILLVDDEPDILNLLASVLESEGYEVVTAADGMEGIERFHQEHPDLVITDVKMPRKDGLSVLKEIKAIDFEVDVIVLTGYSDEVTAIDCLRMGAYDYLLKPLEDLEIMLASVGRAIHQRTLKKKNSQLILQIEEMTIKDLLTGLLNFRQIDTYLDDEIARSKRYGHSFGSFMLAVDHFHEVHEAYGQIFRDYVLQKLGETMRQNLRIIDRLFRYDEEVFFILMPETGKEKVDVVVRRILTAVRNDTYICDAHQANITLSIGCAFYPEQTTDKTEIIRYAEDAMYQAQKMGGDRIILHG